MCERRRGRRRGRGQQGVPALWLAAAVTCGLVSWAAGQDNQRSPWNKKADYTCQGGGVNSTWTELLASAAWTGRSDMGCVAFNNNIFVAGGQAGAAAKFALLNDVWVSADARTWTPMTAQAEWKGRKNFGMLTFNKRMWILGGLHKVDGQLRPTNSIWSSSDGKKWDEVKRDSAHCAGDACTQVAAKGLSQYIQSATGGSAGVAGEPVVVASNGGAAGATGYMWAPRHSMVTFDFLGKMFVVSGVQSAESVEMAATIDFRNDVWSTQDGVQWVLETADTPFASRRAVQGTVHQLVMYVLAESKNYRNYYNIWGSRDGKKWTEPAGSCTGVQLSPCARARTHTVRTDTVTHTPRHTHTHTHTRTHTRTHAWVRVRTQVHMHSFQVAVDFGCQRATRKHTNPHTHSMSGRRHTHARSLARTHARTHAHTHTHTHSDRPTIGSSAGCGLRNDVSKVLFSG